LNTQTLYSEAITSEKTFQNKLFEEIKRDIEKMLFSMNNDTLSSNAMNSDQLSSNQLNLHHLSSNSSDQDQNQDSVQTQLDHQIEQSIETQSKKNNSENQTHILLNEAKTIDLSTPSQKLDQLFTRKRKTEKERQNALRKKFETIKIPTLVLSIDETLKNAQKTLFEDLKVAKIEHVMIQRLINQIERTRVNLDLTDEVSAAINQIQTEKNFEFAAIDLTKKTSSLTTSYNETMSENFQQLKKRSNKK
jgi:hypothetical protein